jgi:arabinan endo-1,5-alpha-L-arabinosidase
MPYLKMRLLSVFSVLMLASIANAIVEPILVVGNTYVHDPTMCKDNNGTYFVFCGSWKSSGTVFAYPRPKPATAPGIGIRTSTDRSAWTFAGLVWPNGASWTDQYTGTSNGQVTLHRDNYNT